jgi:glutathione S-transferase
VLRIHDRVSLFESKAIAEYLDETVAPRLHPEDPVARAVNRAWTDYVPDFAGLVTATAYADTEAAYHAAVTRTPIPGSRRRSALRPLTRRRAEGRRNPRSSAARYSGLCAGRICPASPGRRS